MAEPDATVDDVNGHARAGGVVGVALVAGNGMLVDPV
jgi:hypothetical protein